MQLTLKGQDIPYFIIRKKNLRSIRIRIYYGGVLHITAPYRVSQRRIEQFIRSKADWIIKRIQHMKGIECADLCNYSDEHYKQHKANALDFIKNRVLYWNRKFGFQVNNIKVRKQKTRWGSCSSKQNLNFNYKILFLPREMQDYIIVHELCHLKEMNHSKRFWTLVETALPDYKEIRGRF